MRDALGARGGCRCRWRWWRRRLPGDRGLGGGGGGGRRGGAWRRLGLLLLHLCGCEGSRLGGGGGRGGLLRGERGAGACWAGGEGHRGGRGGKGEVRDAAGGRGRRKVVLSSSGLMSNGRFGRLDFPGGRLRGPLGPRLRLPLVLGTERSSASGSRLAEGTHCRPRPFLRGSRSCLGPTTVLLLGICCWRRQLLPRGLLAAPAALAGIHHFCHVAVAAVGRAVALDRYLLVHCSLRGLVLLLDGRRGGEDAKPFAGAEQQRVRKKVVARVPQHGPECCEGEEERAEDGQHALGEEEGGHVNGAVHHGHGVQGDAGRQAEVQLSHGSLRH
mmetsp:Transcript_14800/g.41658  ORF Transcript_14800/g.41658 Transcript_14800/m.41658 type:complete len:329 (+) Transcript_14800:1142-2128(+)